MLGAQAFCPGLAAASFNRAYGYPRSVGGVAIVLPRPNGVLVAQAVSDGLATAFFDAASPHYPRFVGRISIGAASPLVVLGAQGFTARLGSASLDVTLSALRNAQAATGGDVAAS